MTSRFTFPMFQQVDVLASRRISKLLTIVCAAAANGCATTGDQSFDIRPIDYEPLPSVLHVEDAVLRGTIDTANDAPVIDSRPRSCVINITQGGRQLLQKRVFWNLNHNGTSGDFDDRFAFRSDAGPLKGSITLEQAESGDTRWMPRLTLHIESSSGVLYLVHLPLGGANDGEEHPLFTLQPPAARRSLDPALSREIVLSLMRAEESDHPIAAAPDVRNAIARLESAKEYEVVDSALRDLAQALSATGERRHISFHSLPVRGATIKYRLIADDYPITAHDVTDDAMESLPIGLYCVWSERNNVATSNRDAVYCLLEDGRITITESTGTGSQ